LFTGFSILTVEFKKERNRKLRMMKFTVRWNPAVIILSIGIAFIGAYGVIVLCEQLRLCAKENRSNSLKKISLLWLMAMSLGGVAIWYACPSIA
jgi:NO-binding membrane sensor protein with MHYT domain